MSGHGKTLEMKAIKIPPPVHLCVCRKPWPDHLRKDGKRLKKYANEKHYLAGVDMNTLALQDAMDTPR